MAFSKVAVISELGADSLKVTKKGLFSVIPTGKLNLPVPATLLLNRPSTKLLELRTVTFPDKAVGVGLLTNNSYW